MGGTRSFVTNYIDADIEPNERCERMLREWYLQFVSEWTGNNCALDHDDSRIEETRPVVAASQ